MREKTILHLVMHFDKKYIQKRYYGLLNIQDHLSFYIQFKPKFYSTLIKIIISLYHSLTLKKINQSQNLSLHSLPRVRGEVEVRDVERCSCVATMSLWTVVWRRFGGRCSVVILMIWWLLIWIFYFGIGFPFWWWVHLNSTPHEFVHWKLS